MTISFNELLEVCQSEAICDELYPTTISIWDKICREYSRVFHTPLADVVKLDPEFVVKNYYGHRFDTMDIDENIEDILETLQVLKDPSYQRSKEDDLSRDIAKYEAEEKARLKAGKSIHKKRIRKEMSIKDVGNPPEQLGPKEGFVNFDALRESNEK